MEFEKFDSLDDMLAAIDSGMKEADARVQPFQVAAKPGDFYSHFTPYGFTIYGQILRDRYPRPPRLENYRFVRAYSVACPRGELGDLHVASIDRILTAPEFLLAKMRLWADEGKS